MTRTSRVVVLGMSLWLADGVTLAAENPAEEKWEWTLGAYLWMSDVSLDKTVVGNPALGADTPFSDLVDKREGAFQVHFGQAGPAYWSIGLLSPWRTLWFWGLAIPRGFLPTARSIRISISPSSKLFGSID